MTRMQSKYILLNKYDKYILKMINSLFKTTQSLTSHQKQFRIMDTVSTNSKVNASNTRTQLDGTTSWNRQSICYHQDNRIVCTEIELQFRKPRVSLPLNVFCSNQLISFHPTMRAAWTTCCSRVHIVEGTISGSD